MFAITLHYLTEISFYLACGAWLIYAYFVLFHGGVPNIRTAPAIREEIIRLLRDDYAARTLPRYTIYDLGSGNGHLTRQIAKALPQANVVGVELNALSVLWSNWMKKRQGLDNLTYVRSDFFKIDWSQGNAFVIFMLPSLLTRIAEKLEYEAAPHSLIICNKFRLGRGWIPQEERKIKTRYLHQGKIFIYRKA